MQITWPVTGLTSATSHFAGAAGVEVSANAAPLIAVNPSRIVPIKIVPIVFTIKLSMFAPDLKPSADILRPFC
jgi:hypothetical protein